MNHAASEQVPQEICRGYRVRRERWPIAGTAFDLSWPADIDDLLERPRTRRRHRANGYMPYWAQPWPSSLILAGHLLAGPPGEGRAAIELGCGVALAGLAAARMGWSVTVSDYDREALAFALLNAERNGLRFAAAVQIDYCRSVPDRHYDLVIGSDLLYERRYARPLAGWIAAALRPSGTALICDPWRSAADSFTTWARQAGLNVEILDRQTTGPAGLIHRGRIWRLTLE